MSRDNEFGIIQITNLRENSYNSPGESVVILLEEKLNGPLSCDYKFISAGFYKAEDVITRMWSTKLIFSPWKLRFYNNRHSFTNLLIRNQTSLSR